MDEVLIRNALNSMLEATKDDATPIIRRLARVQARAALDTLASAPAGDGVEEMARAIFEADPDVGMTWAAFLALAEREPDFLQNVEHVRRAARAAALARPRAAVGEREVEMMVVLERVAMLLHTHWLTTADEKAFRALADEVTPLLEGIGMTVTDGGYGFDWEAAHEAAIQRMGGHRAVWHRLALQSPPAKVEPIRAKDEFAAVCGEVAKVAEAWSRLMAVDGGARDLLIAAGYGHEVDIIDNSLGTKGGEA